MSPRIVAIAACVACFVGCGGSQQSAKDTSTVPPDEGTVTPTSTEVHPPNDGTQPPTQDVPEPLTAERCEALLNHMSQLLFDDKVRALPENEKPTPEDLQVARDKLRGELMQQCVGAPADLFAYDCAMAAQDIQAMGACLGEPSGT